MTVDLIEIEPRLELALAAAREAGAITREFFRRDDVAVEWKKDRSPVTLADRRAEECLRARIAGVFPDDGLLGEEFPERPGTSGFRWILDPIDGTTSFIHGMPLYGMLIGVERQAKSLLGVIHIPALDEWVYAVQGGGAWYRQGDQPPRPAHVSQRHPLGESLFLTSEVRGFADTGRQSAYERLQAAARETRTWGDCYGYLMVATGRADVMIDPIMSLWDAAALQPILKEAGGTFTDWQGRPTIYSGEGIATNGLLLEEVLRLLRA
jgi:histidinol-phosphatase